MRQAGRYLPEYRETRAKAGDFLSLCYNSDLATEVTLQPIRRYGFDAAILFADILLIPQALGADLWFVTGEGPRLSTITTEAELKKLGPVSDIDETLSPIYQTVKNLSSELPKTTTLIGFAGAPWTVATYMIAGRGTPDQAPAKELMSQSPDVFEALLAKITEATKHYLDQQILAGAEVVKIFDSWAGSLSEDAFYRYAHLPAKDITQHIKSRHPNVPVVCFPKGARKEQLISFAKDVGCDGMAIGQDVDVNWAAEHLQPHVCVQGNLDPAHMVSGGPKMIEAAQHINSALAGGPHIFNLGHGITPDANPDHVSQLIDAIRSHSS